jgi:hypothetical protein
MTNKTLDALNKSEAFVGAIIEKMKGLNKSRKKFMISLFLLFMDYGDVIIF